MTVQPLDIAILHGFTWLDILNPDALLLTPVEEGSGTIFRAVIYPDNLGFTPSGNNLFQDGRYPFCRHREVRFYCQYLPIVIVHDVQDPDLSPIYQSVAHK